METIVYADVLFFINFVIDGLCLTVSALLLGRHFSTLRILAGSAIGGLYAIAAVAMNGLHPLLKVLLHLCAAFVICLAAFRWRCIAGAAVNTGGFFLVSALLGGVLYAVYSLCGAFAMYDGAFYAELSAPALIASAVIISAVLIFCLLKAKSRATAKYADLRFRFRGKECLAHCLCDSGNMLVCPYTGLPVAVLGMKTAGTIFSSEELEALSASPVLEDVRPIPAAGLGGEALLPSFVPEKAEIRAFGRKEFKDTRVCIALKLENSDFAGSDGIIPPCLL